MQRRWFFLLLSVMLCLVLLPSAALAANTSWGNRSRTANNQSNRNYRNGAWGAPTRNHGGFGTWGTRTPSSANNGGWGYSNNNGYYGNPNYGQGGYWGYGDRDYWRHRHHRRHDDDDDDDGGYYRGGGYRGGGWGNNGWYNNGIGNTPPGWQHGRKTGWGNSGLPPGQAKKGDWR
jgi:hypothetical protein